jgi:PIN domain nuclease of toxin-antitoxin system
MLRALVLSMMLAGCGSSAELVVVTVHGSRSGVAQLAVLVTLDGKQAMQLQTFAAGTSDFGLELPDGAHGALDIAVAGLDTSQCIVSIATADAQAGGQSRLDLTVTLAPVSPPKC